MRQLRQTRYTKSKHLHTYPFHPGNIIEVDRIPAYNTQGKTYKRILPPIRDQQIINISLLCILLNKLVPHNQIECIESGISINKTEVTISEGLVSFRKLKFRFRDLKELLLNLIQEQILIANLLDVKAIKDRYFRELNSADNE